MSETSHLSRAGNGPHRSALRYRTPDVPRRRNGVLVVAVARERLSRPPRA